jgi:hypothetical protein
MQAYRMTISSSDVLPGGTASSGTFELDAPDVLNIPGVVWNLAVEHFVLVGDFLGASMPSRIVQVDLGLSRPGSFHTATKGPSTVAVVLGRNGGAAGAVDQYHRDITWDSIGDLVVDPATLRRSQLRVQLRQGNYQAHSSVTLGSGTHWVMGLVAYPRKSN